MTSRKPRKTGDDGDAASNYIYADEMSFLIPTLEERPGYNFGSY